MQQAYQRHLIQVGFVDRLVGDLLDRLRKADMYERSLVVVTADHGITFRLGQPQRDPTAATLPDIALVPLFVKQPGQREGDVIDHHVEITDVLPTTVGRRLHRRHTPVQVRHRRDVHEQHLVLDHGRRPAAEAARRRGVPDPARALVFRAVVAAALGRGRARGRAPARRRSPQGRLSPCASCRHPPPGPRPLFPELLRGDDGPRPRAVHHGARQGPVGGFPAPVRDAVRADLGPEERGSAWSSR
jgi:sulfatase-like protein